MSLQEQVFPAAAVDATGHVAFVLNNSAWARLVSGGVTIVLNPGDGVGRNFRLQAADNAGNLVFDCPATLSPVSSGTFRMQIAPGLNPGFAGAALVNVGTECWLPPGSSVAVAVDHIDTSDTAALVAVLEY